MIQWDYLRVIVSQSNENYVNGIKKDSISKSGTRVVTCDFKYFNTNLNNFGIEGWELVSSLQSPTYEIHMFKRPMPPAQEKTSAIEV